jgi:hypothetical protein
VRRRLLIAGITFAAAGILVAVAVTLRRAHDIDESHLYGTWTANYHRGDETITLRPDGTCTQFASFDAGRREPESNECTWEFHDARWSPELTVRNCLMVFGQFKFEEDRASVHGTCHYTPERELFFYVGALGFGSEHYPFRKTD